MPRDQETSFRNEPTTSDDPRFREPSDRFGDGSARSDQDQDDRDLGGRDETVPAGTPIGNELSARHAAPGDVDDEASPANGTASGTVTDAPGEWVAGARGPDYGTDPQAGHDVDAPLAGDADTGLGTPVASGTPFATEDSATAPAATTDAPVTTGGATAVEDVPATTEAPVTTEPSTAADVPATAGAAAATPATPATPVPGAPGTAETPGVNTTSFVTNGDELHADWARIQSSFVDDPRGSVLQAADLVSQVTSSLVAAVQQREQALRGEWESQEGTDTEHLRNALRDYRAYFELLIKL